jgi:hypothetical protein
MVATLGRRLAPYVPRTARAQLNQLPRRWKRFKRAPRRIWDRRYRRTYRSSTARVPSRQEIPPLLNARGLVGTAAEVGVKVANYSDSFLAGWRGQRLISIDPWLAADSDEYVDRANVSQARHDEFYEAARERLDKYGSRSEIWRVTSIEGAQRIEEHSLDCVFLDARHDYESVKEDLEAWIGTLKPGGIFAGHDYADGEYLQGVFGVKSAVDEFFARRGISVHVTKRPDPLFPSWIVEIPPAVTGPNRSTG